MNQLINKKILTVVFLIAGVVIIMVAFFLAKRDDPTPSPEQKPDTETEIPIDPGGGDIIIPEPEPIDPVDPIDPIDPDDDIIPPEDDQTPDDDDIPKPGDNIPKPGDGQQDPDPLKETSYKETFDDPIDPNTEPEKHKEVYERVQDFVHFTVKYPTWLPEGFMMTEVNADEGGLLESGKYYGVNVMTYVEGDKKIELVEGMVDLGTTEEIEEVEIRDGVMGRLWKWQEYGTSSEDSTVLGLSIYLGGTADDYEYYILGDNVDKNNMIDIAKSLESL